MKLVFALAATLIITGCQHKNQAGKASKPSQKVSHKAKAYPYAGRRTKRCSISGLNWKSSDRKLVAGLCKLSKRYGHVYVTSSCRTRKQNRSVKRSYHLYSRGCKASDVYIKGIKGSTILKWWGRNMGGGRGMYHCRGFVHVDTGPTRSWTWNLCRKRKRRRGRA